MAREITVILHAVAEDGLPDHNADETLTGRVAFLWDGNIVNGWPLGYAENDYEGPPFSGRWEADDDVGRPGEFANVTHWIEFPVPLWELERAPAQEADDE